MDKFYNKSNSELVAVCMFCAATQSVDYYEIIKKNEYERK
jgi:hypothetical protein